MRVLLADALDPVCAARLRAGGLEVIERPGLDEDALAAAVATADALVVRGRARVTRRVVEAADHLRVIVRAGTGLDTIDVAAARERGIAVRNVPGGNAVSVAELVFALFLALARHLPEVAAASRAGRARRGAPLGSELAGRTLGIVGFGRIGREVTRRALAFDLRVLATDPAVSSADVSAAGAEPAVGMEAMLPGADLLSLHVPLADGTRGLVGRDALGLLPRGALVVNAARAEILDHGALLAALEDGRVAGAGLDVFDDGSPAAAALRAHPRVILTPHLGAATREAQERVAAAAADIVLETVAPPAASRT